jgi:hypothetical protein
MKKHASRKRLPKMKPVTSVRPHHSDRRLIGLFAAAAAFLVILNAAVLLSPPREAGAMAADNVVGWAWSSGGGWLSMNDTNAGAGGGTYGVNVDAVTKKMTGFAWSSNVGWVCFGQTCTAHPVACGGTPPKGAVDAYIDGSNNARGWAKICNIPNDDGWISLNCTDSPAGCGSSSYRVSVNFGSGSFNGWAFHGLSGAQNGWGWIDFSRVRLSGNAEDFDIAPPLCTDGVDNDFDGDIDCDDDGCTGEEPACPSIETNCALIGHTDCCFNSFDDDFDGPMDCADSDCASDPHCIPEDEHGAGSCKDGVDNDMDGPIDCDDSDCEGEPGCEICDNAPIDDDGDGDVDCDDDDCKDSPVCTPAWLKSKYGNVYATLGVEGNPPPPGQANATYCITTGGTITGFSSEYGCEEEGEEVITLPVGPDGYVSTLGRLDVTGILNGQYGQIKTITSASQIDATLGGKVYVYDNPSCSSPFIIGTKTFMNASGQSGRGNGLLVIKGCDLRITGNLNYQSAGVSQYLRNLASFGILVLAKYNGTTYAQGGNVIIDSAVERIVGTIYAERSISTGSTGNRITDKQLNVYGAFVSREVKLERMWSRPDQAAEVVTFDGRAVVNPPPGFQDVSKSLPALGDTF